MRAAFGYDTDAVSEETGIVFLDKSRAIQSQRDEADINTIVKRFGLTGELPMSQRVPLNLDFDEVLDYRSCMDYVIQAQRSFDSLPAEVRSRFGNDHVSFVEWALDPASLPELRKLGLAPEAPEGSSPAPGDGIAPAP